MFILSLIRSQFVYADRDSVSVFSRVVSADAGPPPVQPERLYFMEFPVRCGLDEHTASSLLSVLETFRLQGHD